MNPLELTLGIMTAVGGFVDISELVFAAKAGSMFGYALIWVFVLGTMSQGDVEDSCRQIENVRVSTASTAFTTPSSFTSASVSA